MPGVFDSSAARCEYDKIYGKYKDDIWRLVYYLTGDMDEARELYQETWLRVVRNFCKIPEITNMKSWIFSISANAHRDILRKKKVRRFYFKTGLTEYGNGKENADDNERVNVNSVDEQDAMNLSLEIADAVKKLPDKQKRVFVLKEIEGFKSREIVEILNIPIGTVKSLLYRAIRNLRENLSVYRTD